MTVISGTLIGPYSDPRPGVTIEMIAVGTTTTVIKYASSRSTTDANGRYSLKVEPGRYDVTISASGQPPERVGSIYVELTSPTGSLNDFLTMPGEEDITPEIVKTVDRMRADAADSAAKAKVSENNAAAAMTNALSKVVTADQSVASAVKFNKAVTINGDLIKGPPLGGGASIIRFYNLAGEETGALYGSPSGKMTLRWAGLEHSAVCNEDGSVIFPSDVYSGSAKLATRATGLGLKHLNTVIEEGDYYQHSSANATVANGYPPIALAGVLKVLKSRASSNGREGVTQIYSPWNDHQYFLIRVYKASTDEWSDWDNYRSQGYNDSRYASLQGIGKTFTDADAFKAWMKSQNGITSFRLSNTLTGFPAYNPALIWNTSDTYAMLMPYYSASEIKCVTGNASGKYQEFFLWNTGNTTVDSNGFIKKASPIVKLFGDGTSELNDESQGVTTERISEGVYRVSGTLGFNSDGAWGGPGNGIEIPVDDNKRPILWIESKVLQDGDIEIRTYHRTYETGPCSTRNVEAMESGELDAENNPIFVAMPDGTPHDIPAGRWIDLRVEMPASDEPEEIIEDEPIQEPETKPEGTETEVEESQEPEQPIAEGPE